jgi:hypothetical protein
MSGKNNKGPVKGIMATIDAMTEDLLGPPPSSGRKKGANNSSNASSVVNVSTSNQFETLSKVDSGVHRLTRWAQVEFLG